MKNKYLLLCTLLIGTASSLRAQDLRERTYYYEILEPRHEPKPEVNGFATERIKEHLNRAPAMDGKGIYLSWRLLEQDDADVSFHLYRTVNGKTERLTKSPVKSTCDFIDQSPANGKASYWICALDKKKLVFVSSTKIEVDLRSL